jgi:azurin
MKSFIRTARLHARFAAPLLGGRRLLLPLAAPIFLAALSACNSNLELSSVGDTMAYDKTLLEAKPGQSVKLTFHNVANSPAMLHDWVLVKPGTIEAVANAGIAAGPGKDYIPDSPDILAHTRLTKPGETDSIEFKAPDTPGDYPYICTYPGHFALMKGILRVQ